MFNIKFNDRLKFCSPTILEEPRDGARYWPQYDEGCRTNHFKQYEARKKN